MLSQYNESVAALAVRVFLGVVFLCQGYDAIFRVKIRNVIETYESEFSSRGIPRFLTATGVWFTSMTELVCGLLLIAGLFQPIPVYLLTINILVASAAFSVTSPMWDMKHVFPRLASLIFLLIIPAEWNTWSLDQLINNIK
jgi:putative oxidoreductase